MAFFSNSDFKEKDYGDTSHKYVEPVLSLPTPEQAARRDELQAKIDSLEAKLKTQTPKLDAEQRHWEARMRTQEASWKPLEVTTARSLARTKLERQTDGPGWLRRNPETDTYVLEVRAVRPEKLTAIRIEALPDPSLPRGGPGRDVYGNFSLTRVRVEAVSSGGEAEPGGDRPGEIG